MASTIRIKKRASSGSAGAPSSLASSELAFNENASDKKLYYGYGDDGNGVATSIIAVGGPGAFVDRTTAQSVAGNKTFSDNVVITGNLTVNGTTTTVNSTTTTVDDPVFTIGGDSAPGSDDDKDRGIEFRWHNGSAAKTGFFGFDDSTGKFTFIPDASNSGETFSGTAGTIVANTFEGNLTGNVTGNTSGSSGSCTGNAATASALASGRTVGMTGDVVWTSGSFDGSGNVTGTSTIQADAVDMAMLNASGTASSSTYLRGDGSWQSIAGADTTYSISCVDGDNSDEEKIRLTAGGDGSGTDDIVLEAGTGLSIARSGDKITFTNTVSDTNTTYSAGTGLSLSGTTFSLGNHSGDLITSGTVAAARVATLNQDTTGSAATLTTARNIGGVSFDGSANIDLPGVNSAGNQNTSGTAAGLSGTPDITVDDVVAASLDISGNADIDGTLEADAITVNGTALSSVIAGTTVTNATTAAVGTAITVADESSDTTCFPLFATAATGNLGAKSGSNLTFNSSSGLLTATQVDGLIDGGTF